ncbi:flavin reductase [Burkholderia sp. Bp8989]|nr:flavin reductase [Burkholderia sp. Bp8995]RQS38878.1 flavin reductase [Burkholderia sp. Bp8989]
MVPIISAPEPATDLPAMVPTEAPRSIEHDATTAQFKVAMRRQALPIAILASGSEDGRAGMIATAVISVSMSPASLLISVNRSASLHPVISSSRLFSVNFLAQRHERLVSIFSGALKGEERFLHGDWKEAAGIPVLSDAHSSMICEVESSLVYGSHQIFVGRVKEVEMGDSTTPLIWADGGVVRAR